MDNEDGSELFSNYEAELKLVQADLNQRLDRIPELSGDDRKQAVAKAESSLEEFKELLESMNLEKENIPANKKSKVMPRFRNYQTDHDTAKRKLALLSDDRTKLFGKRYRDEPEAIDEQMAQRQQLLSGTDRLERSSARLKESQRIGYETENIGRETLASLSQQRETLTNTHRTLLESEGYTDNSNKTLRTMARRMVTNKIITIAIITVLVILILAVIISKFR